MVWSRLLNEGNSCSYVMLTLAFAGATNFRGQFVFTGEGQGNDTAPSLYLMNPVEPYNTTGEQRLNPRRRNRWLVLSKLIELTTYP